MSDIRDRFDSTLARADEVLRKRLKLEQAQLEAEDAARADEAREKARADVEKRRMVAAKFDDAFRAFSVETPQARDDKSPGQYRRRLFSRLQRKLPDTHDLVDIRADDLPSGQAYLNFEQMIIDAAKAEGEHPSEANLPRDGSLIARQRVDDATNAKWTEYFGRSSFIKELGREGRRVQKSSILFMARCGARRSAERAEVSKFWRKGTPAPTAKGHRNMVKEVRSQWSLERGGPSNSRPGVSPQSSGGTRADSPHSGGKGWTPLSRRDKPTPSVGGLRKPGDDCDRP